MNLSFPAIQPGTEEPRDLAYLQNPAQPTAAAPRVAAASAAAAPMPATIQAAVQQPAVQQPAAQQAAAQQPAVQPPVAPAPAADEESLPALERRDPSVVAPRAGVNSMFGL